MTSLIKSRRSIRRYKPKKVPKRLVREILESARWAPSLHNTQPWKFIVPEGGMKKRLAGALKKAQYKEALLIRMRLKDSITAIEQAPLVILAYSNNAISNKVKKGGRLYSDYLGITGVFEIQSVACAVQNMLLTAHSLGLGAAWFGIPIFGEKAVNRIFKVNYRLMAILTIGYPEEKAKTPARKPLKDIVSFMK